MEVAFADARLERLCGSPELLQDRLGEQAARRAQAQLASLRAALSLEEFRHLPGRCREAADQRIVVDVFGDLVLTLEPTRRSGANGRLTWDEVRSVRVVSLTTTRRSHG
ncbi:MAG TPA: hypothetical protein PKD59_13245 [Miltoncostaeaceae bacterium]|nr:hypothetical protein [Miltoncostaeaceae bacterium]